MKTERRTFGDWGERVAAAYLVEHEYAVRDVNWTVGHLEIDIVAEWYGEVIFVEVKTRRNEFYHAADEAVDYEKQTRLVEAAAFYRRQRGLTDAPYRFDVITVVGSPSSYTLRHMKRAYDEYTLSALKRR